MHELTVDASWFGATGIGRFADEVLRRAPASITLREVARGQPNASLASPLRLRAGHRRLPEPRPRAFWSPGFMPPLLPSSVWQSVTVHDLTHRHHYGWRHKLAYATMMRPLFRRMDLIFTVSEFSRREILEWTGMAPDRVVTIHHGIDAAYCAEGPRLDLGAPYVLYVGNRRPYKNLPRLFRAFARSGLAARGFLLALSGSVDAELRQLAESVGLSGSVRFLGHVPEAELPAAYRGAQGVAFVSLYEGFGFPIIEAMACGVPVVTSAVSSMPEVAGGAALLVRNPESDEEVAAALLRLCTDDALRMRLVQDGLVRVRAFDWDAAAKAYWDRIQPHC